MRFLHFSSIELAVKFSCVSIQKLNLLQIKIKIKSILIFNHILSVDMV